MQTPYEIRVMPPESRFDGWSAKTSAEHFEIQFYEDHLIFDFWFTVAVGESVANPTSTYRLDGELRSRGIAIYDKPPQTAFAGWTKDYNPLNSWSRFVFNAGDGVAGIAAMGCIIPTSGPSLVPIPAEAYCRYRNRYDLRRALV